MRKLISLIAIMFIMSMILIACSDDNDGVNQENSNADNISAEENNESSNELDENSDEIEDEDSRNDLEITEEDQEDLKMGDTGTVDTVLGTYEMTLDDAELVGPELDGEETYDDDLILLDITIKNIGDDTIDLEDAVAALLVGEDLKGGSFDGAEDFDSVEKFTGKLDPGEEESGQFITDVVDADEYYLMQDFGSFAAGGTNQVIWTFGKEEID